MDVARQEIKRPPGAAAVTNQDVGVVSQGGLKTVYESQQRRYAD